jgi:hypothetical protein
LILMRIKWIPDLNRHRTVQRRRFSICHIAFVAGIRSRSSIRSGLPPGLATGYRASDRVPSWR